MQPFTIAGSDAGLQTNKKAFLLPDKAFPVLENAYVWRDRVKKRECLELLGRLQRDLGPSAFGNFDGGGNFSQNLVSFFSLEASATIVPGSFTATTAAMTFTDISPITQNPPNGIIFDVGGNGRGRINYATGLVQITY